ncbi:MAG: glycosyltransferase, partial [Bdellovibrionota bacterium]
HTLTGGGIRWLLVGGTLYSLIYALGTTGLFLRRRAESEPRARVLYLTQFLGLGGLERMILNLSSELKEQGKYDPVVVVYDDMQGGVGLHGEFELRGVPVVTLSKTGGFSVRAVAKIVREILRRRILVIHSHDLGALIYAVFAKWATLGGVRIVHTQHSFIHLEKHPRYRQYERFFSMFVDQLSTVSEGLQKQYSTVGIEPARVAVVPNGVEFPKAAVLERPELLSLRKKQLDSPEVAAEPEASSRLHALRESVWVLCMARVHPKKGQEHVAELWRALPESARKKAALIFVGQETFQGALARLREKIAGLPDRDRVVYAGFTMKPGPWLQAADIAVSGSEFEGMPLGPIESVGAGMQVLVSAIEGHSMLPLAIPRFSLENPATGAADLAQMIEKAAGLPRAVREALWSSGRQAREQFGIAAMAQRYAEFYHSVGK